MTRQSYVSVVGACETPHPTTVLGIRQNHSRHVRELWLPLSSTRPAGRGIWQDLPTMSTGLFNATKDIPDK